MKKVLTLTIALFTALTVSAASFDMGQSLMEIGEDAAQGYLSPAVTVFGTGMNAGWYNSSKSLTMFKLPVGISVLTINEAFVNIDKDMQEFDFKGKLPAGPIMDPIVEANPTLTALGITTWQQLVDYSATLGVELPTTIAFNAKGVPTVFGSDEPKEFTVGELFADDPSAAYLFTPSATPGSGVLASQSGELVELPFVGANLDGLAPSMPAITMVTLGVKKIPVIDNFQLGLRYFPTQKLGSFGEIGQFGLKIQHEFTRFVPVVKDLPFLHTSAYWAMNGLDIKAGPATISQSNWVAMVNASADVKFLLGLGAFIGLGVESSNLTLDMDMSELDLPDYSLTIDGSNGFRFQVGARLSLLVFDVFADANYGAVTSYNVGICVIGLNGL